MNRAGKVEALLDGPGADDRVGRRIGSYRLVGLVGRGGMGSVYRAVRDDDQFEQVVALKLLRFSDADPSVRQRFQAERQILALLEHPNVARLLDGGSADGQPYFVMEYVEGRALDRYCAERRLGVRARVALFLDVCSAVQYAHQNLVVHRDLKPGNILVTADGRPKLLDFGIAKLLDTPVGPATATLWQPMTPEYASPEQASGAPISTASDVYSLGVLLYELLAGGRPHELRGLSPEELRRVICGEVPAAPSLRVAGLGRQSPADGALPEPPERWSRQLRGDLDTIVLMALRKEPRRRYASVEALAEDLRRFLDGRPVRARRDTWSYRSGKFLRRNRWPVASAALLLLSLLGGVGATVWQKRRAERRFQDVRGLARTFIFEVHDAVAALPGSTAARGSIVATGVEYLDRLATDAGDDAVLLEELAHGYERLGDAAGGFGQPNRGDLATALASYEKALALRRRLDAGARTTASVRAVMSVLNSLGRTHVASGRQPAGLICLNEVLALGKTRGPADAQALARELSTAHATLGSLSLRDGRQNEAALHLRTSLEWAQTELRRAPDDPRALALLAVASGRLAEILHRSGRLDDAHQAFEATGRTWEMLLAHPPNDRAQRREHALFLANRATFLGTRGQLAEGMRLAELAVSELGALAASDPQDAGAQLDLFLGNLRLASVAKSARRFDTAIGAARKAVEVAEALLVREPDNLGRDRGALAARVTLAEILEQAGRRAEAVTLRRRALDGAEERLRRSPDLAYAREDVSKARQALERLLKSGAPPREPERR